MLLAIGAVRKVQSPGIPPFSDAETDGLRTGVRRKPDRIPAQAGQHSDDCGQSMILA